VYPINWYHTETRGLEIDIWPEVLEMSLCTSDEKKFIKIITQGANLLGLEIDSESLQRLIIHQRMMLKWAQRMNLTTVKEPQAMAERLYLDSAILLPHLDSKTNLHDIGTGAGFPGLVLKAINPNLRVTVTEARRKKVTFLKTVAREMGLSYGLEIRWERLNWEKEKRFSETSWNEVVSRAAFPPKEWVRIGSKLVSKGGRLWIYSGQPFAGGDCKEISDPDWMKHIIPKGFEQEELISYCLPFCRKNRILISLRRI